MSDERSSEKNDATSGTDNYHIAREARLQRKADTAQTKIESTLDARKAKEKDEGDPWYFTHL